MNSSYRRVLSFVLTIILLVGILPTISLAATADLVLKKIGHTSTDTVSITSASTRSVALKVPYLYSGNTVDLSKGLIVEKATGIDSIVTSFKSGSTATVNGSEVIMTVTYFKGGNTDNEYSTTYSIKVTRSKKVTPVFDGTITKSVTDIMPNAKTNDIVFKAADFTKLYTANDGGAITKVAITGSSLSCGSLKLLSGSSYTAYNGAPIKITDTANLVFDAVDGGSVSYLVYAYGASDDPTSYGPVLLNITVNEISVPTISSGVTKSVSSGSTITYSLSDFTSVCNLNGGKLANIEITPTNSGYGTWYNGTKTFTGSTVFTSETIGNLKFKGTAKGTATFTWRISNEAGYSSAKESVINVSESDVPDITHSVTKQIAVGSTLTFSLNDFKSCYDLNNGTLNQIVIKPTNSGYGRWYKGSSQFTGATVFTESNIGTLKFVGTAAGQAKFSWTVSNQIGTSDWGSGTVTVGSSTEIISYTTAKNTAKTFSVSDFNEVCLSKTGETLDYVNFVPPSSSYGTLYYNYSSSSNPGTVITSSKELYRNSSPYLSDVTFVPKTNYTGTVSITYGGVSVDGDSYSGTVKIVVGSTSSSDVSYTTAKNTPKTFDEDDFEAACISETGDYLDYVNFIPPSSSYGTLYYNYSSSSNPGTAVTSSKELYMNSSPYLSNVTFVPKTNYTGTVSISFVGTSDDGESFTGTVKINVGGSSSSDVSYTTAKNTPKMFDEDDFNEACDRETGDDLDYVNFIPPSSSYGTLYYNYSSSSNPGTAVTSSKKLYMNRSPYLSDVTFVPKSNYTGTVSISFVGTSDDGESFTGTVTINVGSSSSDVSYSTAKNTPKTFDADDFNTACINETGDRLDYVNFVPPSSSYGTLYYNYSSSSNPGTAVTSSKKLYMNRSPYLSDVTFVPKSNYTGTVSISFVGTSDDGESFTGTVTIKVGSSSSDVSYSTAKNTPKTFDVDDFNTACINETGDSLDYVNFVPPSSSYGALYYNYSSSSNPGTAVTSSKKLYRNSSPYLSDVTFVPKSNYTGTVSISFVGTSNDGESFTGTVTIEVGSADSSDVTYATAKNTPKTFDADDFNTACVNETGDSLDYVNFTPPSSNYGTLYYNYISPSNLGTVVTSGKELYRNDSPYLSDVAFVPKSDYTGTVSISFIGTSDDGETFTGTVSITVGSTELSDVTYTTAKNTPKAFDASDFNSACVDSTGERLDYVILTPPLSSSGILYYDYSSSSDPGTAITSATKFYQSSSPRLSDVTFVPAENFSSTATIPYTGYNTDGVSFSGTVEIIVGSSAVVSYTTTMNSAKTFDADDFNVECIDETGEDLYFVEFTLPSESYGILYFNYSSSQNRALVTEDTLYYMSDSPNLSSVTFVPATNYEGTFTFKYTGYSIHGETYTGLVSINVTGASNDITYTTDVNTAVALKTADFNTVCTKVIGDDLDYVVFTLPSASYGTLYYNYVSSTNKGTAVPAGAKLYTDISPYITYVKFVPAANYSGNVTISYTGYDVDGETFTGKIIIKVGTGTGSKYFTDVGSTYSWAAESVDYLYERDVVTGVTSTLYSPATSIKRGDFILMLYRALDFSGSTVSNFSDVPKGSYYYDAIAAAKSLGIAQGENNKFKPEAALTRQDAMVLIYRALSVTDASLSAGSSSDISGFTDKGKISSYALTAVQTLVKAGIVTGSNSKINPLGSLTRAEMAVILYRVMKIV
jgi:hypothetical protein